MRPQGEKANLVFQENLLFQVSPGRFTRALKDLSEDDFGIWQCRT